MKNFVVVRNPLKDRNNKMTDKVIHYMTDKGARCVLVTDVSEIEEDTEAVIVLGGDGTLLRASKMVVERQLPLLGVNLGTLGYLAEVDKSSIFNAMDRLLADDFLIEKRMMLEAVIMRGDKILKRDLALNDVVVIRHGPLRVINFMQYVNGSYLNSYSADGIIISSATGSTGYSLSAGGPIVSPEAEVIMLTPVAAHTLNARSVIFGGDDEICVELSHGHVPDPTEAAVSFDGGNEMLVTDGDRVIVHRSALRTNLIKLSDRSFLEVLRQKMAAS